MGHPSVSEPERRSCQLEDWRRPIRRVRGPIVGIRSGGNVARVGVVVFFPFVAMSCCSGVQFMVQPWPHFRYVRPWGRLYAQRSQAPGKRLPPPMGRFRDDALEAVDRVERSGRLVLGEEVGAFEGSSPRGGGSHMRLALPAGSTARDSAPRRCSPAGARCSQRRRPPCDHPPRSSVPEPSRFGVMSMDGWPRPWKVERRRAPILPSEPWSPFISTGIRSTRGLERHCSHTRSSLSRTALSPLARSGWDVRPPPRGSRGRELYPTKNLGALGDGGVS